MGFPSQPSMSKLFFAVMYQPEFPIQKLIDLLDKKFGEREYNYGPIQFSWSDYYRDEMGSDLRKIYFNYISSFEREKLPSLKLFSNELEAEFAVDGKRIVNIDPGYIARDKLVLATTKDFYHRVYLGNGIFGEVTLHYRRGRFRFFSWTYPDYKEENFFNYLEKARATLVKQIRLSE